MKYKIDSTSLTAIADAIREKTGKSELMTPTEMPDEIASISGGGGGWVRPSDWPDIDALASQIVGDQDCVYLTYDLRKHANYQWIGLYGKTADSSAWTVDRGHVSNGAFVVDETNSINSNAYFRQELNQANGDIQLFRVTATGHITDLRFATRSTTASSNYNNNCQPCVQRAGTLPWVTMLSGAAGTSSTSICYCTIWMEKDALIPGKNAVVTSMQYAWQNAYNLYVLDVSNWNTSNWANTNLQNTWANCFNLKSLDLSNWDTSNWVVNNFTGTWDSCISLETLNIDDLDTSNWRPNGSINGLFNRCYALKKLDLTGWDVSDWPITTLMTSMFADCVSLEELDVSDWDTSGWTVANTNSFINNCYRLHTILGMETWSWASQMTTNIGHVNNRALRNFKGIPYALNHSYNEATMLTHESLVSILTTLPIVSTSRTITLGQTNKSKLTAEEIAIATGKGWTVA